MGVEREDYGGGAAPSGCGGGGGGCVGDEVVGVEVDEVGDPHRHNELPDLAVRLDDVDSLPPALYHPQPHHRRHRRAPVAAAAVALPTHIFDSGMNWTLSMAPNKH